MNKSYYQYCVSLETYQTEERVPEIVLYESKYRDSFVTCLRKCNNTNLIRTRKKELKRGSKIVLLRPRGHVRGWAVITPTGIIEDYGMQKGIWTWKKYNTYKFIILRSCLTIAVEEMDLQEIKFRVPVEDYYTNKQLETFWPTTGCTMKVSSKYY